MSQLTFHPTLLPLLHDERFLQAAPSLILQSTKLRESCFKAFTHLHGCLEPGRLYEVVSPVQGYPRRRCDHGGGVRGVRAPPRRPPPPLSRLPPAAAAGPAAGLPQLRAAPLPHQLRHQRPPPDGVQPRQVRQTYKGCFLMFDDVAQYGY